MDITPNDINNVVELFPNKFTDPTNSRDAARALAKETCVLNFNPRIFCEEIRKEHPHVQAAVGKLVFKLLRQWAHDYETGNYDRRTRALTASAFLATTQPNEGDMEIW